MGRIMKLILDINNTKVLLDTEQVRQIADILYGCEFIEQKYIPSSGTTKSHYIDLIKPTTTRDLLKLSIMSKIEYDALVLITKLQGE